MQGMVQEGSAVLKESKLEFRPLSYWDVIYLNVTGLCNGLPKTSTLSFTIEAGEGRESETAHRT